MKQNLKIYETEFKPDSVSKRLAAHAFADSIREFYQDAENVKAFEEWKRNKECTECSDFTDTNK